VSKLLQKIQIASKEYMASWGTPADLGKKMFKSELNHTRVFLTCEASPGRLAMHST